MDERYPLAQAEWPTPDEEAERPPAPGRMAVVLAALMLGLLLMGVQLWLLTVALELYLGGHGRQVWQLALASGLIFLGGLLTLRLLGRHPPEPLG
jgi:hypothetical protein